LPWFGGGLVFKRKPKLDDKTKRLLEEELNVTTYTEDEQKDIQIPQSETPQKTPEPDDGYPEIGPSYQSQKKNELETEIPTEPIQETVLDSIEDKEVTSEQEPMIEEAPTLEEELNIKEERIAKVEEEHNEKPFQEEEVSNVENHDELYETEESLDEEEPTESTWKWADTDSEDASDREEAIQAPDFILEDIPEEEDSPTAKEFMLPTKDKVDLNEFFEASKEQKKLKRRDKKEYSRKELKRRKKRQSRARVPEDIRDQKVFLFRKKRYKTVEDFIQYLNDHYLDIDDVAREVLADENFFGFVGKKSGVFPKSLQEFREIKKKIDGNE
jgi:hypothetical protein